MPSGRARSLLVLNERDPEHPLAGGAEVHIYEVFSRLVDRGWAVTHLAASFRGAERECTVRGIRVVRLAHRYLYYAVVPLAARRELRSRRHDLVVDVLNKLPFFSPWWLDAPCFAVVHHLFGSTAFNQVAVPFALVSFLLEKLIPYAYRDTRMLAISPSTKVDLVARGVPAEHVFVVPPGIDHRAYHAGATPDERPLILWIGRLEPYKRADLMLDAMTEISTAFPEARLVFVGEGSARSDLEAKARKLGLERTVRFTGFLPDAEKVAWIQRASCLVNTSEKEGWGMTVIEANACGVPTVSSDVPGFRDSVRDGETGYLYPYGDHHALATRVLELLRDPATRRSMSEKALEWASRFDWERVTDDFERLLSVAIEGSREAPRLVAPPFTP